MFETCTKALANGGRLIVIGMLRRFQNTLIVLVKSGQVRSSHQVHDTGSSGREF